MKRKLTREEVAAIKHHRRHRDMDGHTCLLAECAIHYPDILNAAKPRKGKKRP